MARPKESYCAISIVGQTTLVVDIEDETKKFLSGSVKWTSKFGRLVEGSDYPPYPFKNYRESFVGAFLDIDFGEGAIDATIAAAERVAARQAAARDLMLWKSKVGMALNKWLGEERQRAIKNLPPLPPPPLPPMPAFEPGEVGDA